MEEESCPSEGLVYHITRGTRYRFPDGDRPGFFFTYDVFYVQHPSDDTMCTWALRTDGLVLNIESFQPVAIVDDIEWLEDMKTL